MIFLIEPAKESHRVMWLASPLSDAAPQESRAQADTISIWWGFAGFIACCASAGDHYVLTGLFICPLISANGSALANVQTIAMRNWIHDSWNSSILA